MSDIEQGTPEWFAQRCGKATASRISDIVAKTKTGYSTSRANYMAQLVVERMTNQVGESYSNAAMEWGVEQEIYHDNIVFLAIAMAASDALLNSLWVPR